MFALSKRQEMEDFHVRAVISTGCLRDVTEVDSFISVQWVCLAAEILLLHYLIPDQ